MKEITFLKQNHEKWQQFEALLGSTKGQDPDALADLFIRITDDLSWARTFYPGSNTEKYLNGLAARVHQEIYKNKKERRSRIVSFWMKELPLLMAKNRLNFFITFLLFGVSVWIGVISAQHDEGFVRIILSDAYVDMTLDNIDKGDPLGVYKMENQFVMFLGIALNNSMVALMCIVAGLLGWIGVAIMQFRNGVMLGAFSYFLYAHGAGYESYLTVWIHGVIEIWCIVVAGAAGMAFGKGLWFPGAWPRGTAFMRSTREALKIGIGLVPFFFLAAFFEGFLTRYTAMHDAGRLVLIGGSLVFMVWYFIVYPFFVERKKEGGLLMLHSIPLLGRLLRTARMGNRIVTQKMVFLLTIGFLLSVLSSVSLFMQFTTDVDADLFTNFFLAFSFILGVGCIVFALLTRTLVEEEEFVIDRKGSGKEAVYERNAGAVKV